MGVPTRWTDWDFIDDVLNLDTLTTKLDLTTAAGVVRNCTEASWRNFRCGRHVRQGQLGRG